TAAFVKTLILDRHNRMFHVLRNTISRNERAVLFIEEPVQFGSVSVGDHRTLGSQKDRWIAEVGKSKPKEQCVQHSKNRTADESFAKPLPPLLSVLRPLHGKP